MKKRQIPRLDFLIDKLTNSIENVQSGDSFLTDISLLTTSELKSITKKNGWRFNWNNEIKVAERDIFKLTIANNTNIIQGIISLEVKPDHVYMHLIEVLRSTLANTKHILEYQEIWLHLHANFHFNVGEKVMFHLLQRQNLLTITLKV